MNVDEGKETAKGGVSLFIVVLVIAVVVSLVMLGLGWFNRGSAKLSDTVNSLDSSQFSSYNETEITGDQVRSAIQSFITQDVVLVVDAKGDVYNGALDTAASSGGTGGTLTLSTKGEPTTGTAYNCGLLAMQEGGSEGGSSTPSLYVGDDGKIYAGTKGNDGVLTSKKNQSMKPLQQKRLNQKTNKDYVAPGAHYYCKVIYDPSTTTACGIIFSKVVDKAATPAGG